MPFIVYLLGAGIFALTTSEYMISGLMPQLSAEFGVSFLSHRLPGYHLCWHDGDWRPAANRRFA